MFHSPHLSITLHVLQLEDYVEIEQNPNTWLIPIQGPLNVHLEGGFGATSGSLMGPLPHGAALEAMEDGASFLEVQFRQLPARSVDLPLAQLDLQADNLDIPLSNLLNDFNLTQHIELIELEPGETYNLTPEVGALCYFPISGDGQITYGGRSLSLIPMMPLIVHAAILHTLHSDAGMRLLRISEGPGKNIYPSLGCGARSPRCSFVEALGQGLMRLDGAGSINWANQHALDILRISPESAEKASLFAHLNPNDALWLSHSLSLSPRQLPTNGLISLANGINASVWLYPFGGATPEPEFLLLMNTLSPAKRPTPDALDLSILKLMGLSRSLMFLSRTPSWVVLWGAKGTGKDRYNRVLHTLSPWQRGPHQTLHLGALTPSQLGRALTTGLPGHLSFRLDAASGTTLILKGLEEHSLKQRGAFFKELTRISEHPAAAHVRLVVQVVDKPSHGLPPTESAAGFKRRGPFTFIKMPNLADIPHRIPSLLQIFLEKHTQESRIHFDSHCIQRLKDHVWGENLAELERLAKGLSLLDLTEAVGVSELDPFLETPDSPTALTAPMPTLFEAEGALIKRALSQTKGNKVRAAKFLGITRTRLYRKIAEHQLEGS